MKTETKCILGPQRGLFSQTSSDVRTLTVTCMGGPPQQHAGGKKPATKDCDGIHRSREDLSEGPSTR